MTVPRSPRWTGLKDYFSQREIRRSLPSVTTPGAERANGQISTHTKIQSWSNWAGQKIKRSPTDVATIDEVHLVPGWAARRPRGPTLEEQAENAFDIVLHVSGFATSRRLPELLTRSQRAFLKLARGLIPKNQLTLRQPDTELLEEFPELLHLPPRPSEISDDYEVENLEAHFRNSGDHGHELDDIHFTPQSVPAEPISVELARLHENLKSRLTLFWASSLSSRKIQLFVFLRSTDPKCHQHSLRPLLTQEMLTGPNGHFSGTFTIGWSDIRTHLVDTRITFDQTHFAYELAVEARIISTGGSPELHETPTNLIHIPITHSVVRVISDIDDTIKVSRVTDGARAVFNQVFVKDLEDSIIPEMGAWYDTMWKRGVSFHYVSNSPFELLPVINQFINISNLPRGSVCLRFYGGRSLFNGLLSAPGARKRGNVVDVLDQFPESQFLLVGDSGEQDLELYASLAAERPGQIAGVFIRDVGTVGLEDSTGIKADVGLNHSAMKPKARATLPLPNSLPSHIALKRAVSDTEASPVHPGAIHIPRPTTKRSLPPTPYSLEPSFDLQFSSRASDDSSSSLASTSSSAPSSSLRQSRPVTEGEKRRWELQNRVNKARSIIPPHIMLRVFENPEECVEAEQIIRRFMAVN